MKPKLLVLAYSVVLGFTVKAQLVTDFLGMEVFAIDSVLVNPGLALLCKTSEGDTVVVVTNGDCLSILDVQSVTQSGSIFIGRFKTRAVEYKTYIKDSPIFFPPFPKVFIVDCMLKKYE